MKNITISISDDLARWARVLAAEHDTSLSAFIADMLKAAREKEIRYQEAERRYSVREARPLSDGSAYPDRESLYARRGP